MKVWAAGRRREPARKRDRRGLTRERESRARPTWVRPEGRLASGYPALLDGHYLALYRKGALFSRIAAPQWRGARRPAAQ